MTFELRLEQHCESSHENVDKENPSQRKQKLSVSVCVVGIERRLLCYGRTTEGVGGMSLEDTDRLRHYRTM